MLPKVAGRVNAPGAPWECAMSDTWRAMLVEHDDGLRDILAATRRIAVLGIKPESRAFKPAHYVPRYLQRAGFEVVPVPVYYPDVDTILGQPIHRTVAAVPPPVDLVDVFRRPRDLPPHVPDLIAAAPAAVWFQAGIRHDAVAEALARAGIRVVQDRCLMVDHRRLEAGPAGSAPPGVGDVVDPRPGPATP